MACFTCCTRLFRTSRHHGHMYLIPPKTCHFHDWLDLIMHGADKTSHVLRICLWMANPVLYVLRQNLAAILSKDSVAVFGGEGLVPTAQLQASVGVGKMFEGPSHPRGVCFPRNPEVLHIRFHYPFWVTFDILELWWYTLSSFVVVYRIITRGVYRIIIRGKSPIKK